MILAGDVGGTKSNLALFAIEGGGRLSPIVEHTLPSRDYAGLEDLTREFRELGVEPGDTLLVHSSYKSFGGVEGGPQFENAEAASQYLITEQSICTVPWDDAGAFLRFSVTYEAADETAEDQLMQETESRLKSVTLKWS